MDTTSATVIAVAAFFFPLLIAVVKKERFADWVNGVIAIVCYLFLAAVISGIQVMQGGDFTGQMFFDNFGLVFLSGTIGYATLWKNALDPSITTNVLP
jgi:hypothetical protein